MTSRLVSLFPFPPLLNLSVVVVLTLDYVNIAAVETLLARLDMVKNDFGVSPKVKNDHGYSMELVEDLVQTALQCQGTRARTNVVLLTLNSLID